MNLNIGNNIGGNKILENIMSQVAENGRKFIDELSIKLLKRAGISISENMSNFELIMVYNDLQKRGLRLKMSKNYDNKDMLAIYKIGDLHDDLLFGYIFETKVEENKISIVAVPVE